MPHGTSRREILMAAKSASEGHAEALRFEISAGSLQIISDQPIAYQLTHTYSGILKESKK